MEIKVGEYIRTKHSIGKVENIGGLENELVYFKNCECLKCVDKTEITKHSPNIIDLLEVGDYVNGYQVIREPYIYYHIQFIPIDTQDNWGWGEGIMPLSDVDIKTIVTHEQFAEMEYRV